MADSCWMNFSSIRKITLSPKYLKGWKIFKMTAIALRQKELVFTGDKNLKRICIVNRQHVRSIDRNLFFSKLKLLILRRWWQLWIKSTAMSKLIHNRCKLTCKIIIKPIQTHTCMQTNNCVSVLMFYSLLFSSDSILKQLFASGLGNIVNNPLNFVSGIIRQYLPRLGE